MPTPRAPGWAWGALGLATLLLCLGAGWGVTAVVAATSATSGMAGPPGPPGESGPTGPDGPAGAAGEPGPVGSTGPTGPIGATGPQGARGARGASGTAGSPGAAGATGAVGPVGAVGQTGDAGAAGAEGAAGAAGARGPDGPAGNQGPQGVQGATGPTGAVGPGRIVSVHEEALNARVLSSGPLTGLAPGVWLISSTIYFDVPDATKYDCILSSIIDGVQTDGWIARGEFVQPGIETFQATTPVEILPGQTAIFISQCELRLDKHAYEMRLTTTATSTIFSGVNE